MKIQKRSNPKKEYDNFPKHSKDDQPYQKLDNKVKAWFIVLDELFRKK